MTNLLMAGSLGTFWKQIKSWAKGFLGGYGLVIAKALVVFVLGLLIVSIIKKLVKKNSTKSRKIDNSAASFITSIVALIAYLILIVVFISSLGFSTTGIIASLSSIMLAIALGLQNTLASLANGILLIFTKPFQAGDFVDINGTSGTVKEIKLFSVKLVTPDNLTVVIPNNTVFGSTIINYSKMPARRLDIAVSVAYGTDVDKVKELVNEYVAKDERVKKEPAHFFRLTEWGASSLDFTLRVWVDAADYWNVRFDLLEGLLKLLDENGIEIPFNQLDVHVRKVDEEVQA
ncbi:MAG: mechanosensitive ion channel [Clostridiales bacterium]|nr:mechanosensitive ion channel [Clostridiales bacterium]MBE5747323.1 mechanosensitive ion channel [Clostridiales bacterium]